MNDTFSLEQMSKTENLDANFIVRQYKQYLMSSLWRSKSFNPKLTQDQVANQLGCSGSTLQRYSQDINMPSPYRFPPMVTKKTKDPKYIPR